MCVLFFIKRQITQIQHGGFAVFFRKMGFAFQLLLNIPLHVVAFPIVVVIRLIKPLLLVRIGGLGSSRIGHFAANTELYLCERDVGINIPEIRHVDIFYFAFKPICNQQLAKMWKRILRVWPTWVMDSIARVNRFIPGGLIHEVDNNTQHDRDVNNLLDRLPHHLEFTPEEEVRGRVGLNDIGIPLGMSFVCLTVRDSAYLSAQFNGSDYSYHNYRDSDVQNYLLAADELTNRGYFVVRMGVKVNSAINSTNPMVIDYATNGMRSDFMDIYLGAKCDFCISVSTGFDSVPQIFRRPIVYVNMVPFGYLFTFRNGSIGITKHHFSKELNRELTLKEIFIYGIGFCLSSSDYKLKGIVLIENTPEEIRDLVVEMVERLNGTYKAHEDDEALQKLFWEIYPINAVDVSYGRPLHGEIRIRIGSSFLRNNRNWLL